MKSRSMRWAGIVTRTREVRNVYKSSVGKPERKRPFGRRRRRWENNIRLDIREVGWEGVEWMHGTQDRDQWRAVGNTVMNLLYHKRRRIS